MAADLRILTDAVAAYVASMDDAEFASFTAAVREPSTPPDRPARGGQGGREEAARRFGTGRTPNGQQR